MGSVFIGEQSSKTVLRKPFYNIKYSIRCELVESVYTVEAIDPENVTVDRIGNFNPDEQIIQYPANTNPDSLVFCCKTWLISSAYVLVFRSIPRSWALRIAPAEGKIVGAMSKESHCVISNPFKMFLRVTCGPTGPAKR